jgi:predicted metal-binding membrane protein
MTTLDQHGTGVRRRRGRCSPLTVSIVLAWVAVVVAQFGAGRHLVDHDALLGHRGLPSLGALMMFALAWIVMVTAMMLPSAVPLIRLFTATAAQQPHPRSAGAAFVGGYLAVWTVFGWAALAFDGLVHHAVDTSPWLDAHHHFVAAGVLALAGVYQLSPLKDACLRTCRHPAAYLLTKYRRGTRAALRIGAGHGLFCLGCCWALMLVAFALGMTQLALMAGFTALMAYEKTGRHGVLVAEIAGLGLLIAAVAVATHH